jgi:hypothetical protein
MVVKCGKGHEVRMPVVLPGAPLPVLTCWACVAGAS